ncbi:MAG: hypothetical protein LC808_36565, partial [Actinobacteria bacterium]|nr:hypothetical protein [Actinomycetota bacterium]
LSRLHSSVPWDRGRPPDHEFSAYNPSARESYPSSRRVARAAERRRLMRYCIRFQEQAMMKPINAEMRFVKSDSHIVVETV